VTGNILVTGIGVIGPGSAVGAGRFWQILIGVEGLIARLTRFDPSGYPTQIAGQVCDRALERFIDSRAKRTTSHAAQLAIGAGELAMDDSRLPVTGNEAQNFGVFVGSALGGWTQGEQQLATLIEKGASRINPFLVNSSGPHSVSTELAFRIGAHGNIQTVSTGCASSTQAIADAVRQLHTQEVSACIAGGTESPISPMVVSALARTEELSTRHKSPERASRPFDRDHDGMVLSEGACFLVLENSDAARERGAHAYAEILGGATSCDAEGLYQFDQSVETGARAIHKLLRRTGVTPDQIDYVCAHANSSPAFDRKEVTVLKKAFGEFAAKIPVSSIKGVLGHPFGASGAFQTAAAALAIQNDLIPPTHNLEEPDPDCDLDLVMGEPRKKTVRHALVTSYGYGGINAYLLLRKFEG